MKEPSLLAPAIASTPNTDEDDRLWSAIAHLSSLSGYLLAGAGAILGPLIVWLVKRDDSTFIDRHGKEAVNFNLSMLLIGLALSAFTVVTLGIGVLFAIPLIIFFAVAHVWCTVKAAVSAKRGRHYRYPFTIRFID